MGARFLTACAMPKNILIFSDGTGQAGGLTPDENVSNIYKLYRATRCGPENNIDPSQQLTFYDSGARSIYNSVRPLHSIADSRVCGFGCNNRN